MLHENEKLVKLFYEEVIENLMIIEKKLFKIRMVKKAIEIWNIIDDLQKIDLDF